MSCQQARLPAAAGGVPHCERGMGVAHHDVHYGQSRETSQGSRVCMVVDRDSVFTCLSETVGSGPRCALLRHCLKLQHPMKAWYTAGS